MIPLAPCSNWYVPRLKVPFMAVRLVSDPLLCLPAILPPKNAPIQILPAGLFPPPWHQKLTSPRDLRRLSPDDVLRGIPTRNHQFLPPQPVCHLHAANL
jgi:hypothetical protein